MASDDYGDFRGGAHLPNNRRGQAAADPYGLPRQRAGTTPQMHGRYPEHDVLRDADHWDEVTRALVLGRLDPPGPLRFFTADEAAVLEPFLDLLLAQDSEPRIPVLPVIDARHADGKGVGYRYANMPTDEEVWRLVARGLDEAARQRDAPGFAQASRALQQELVEALAEGEVHGGAWDRLDLSRAWSIITRDAVDAFYRHPWAWNEIGFGGPSYPRGRMRLAMGNAGAEPHEATEQFDLDAARDISQRGM